MYYHTRFVLQIKRAYLHMHTTYILDNKELPSHVVSFTSFSSLHNVTGSLGPCVPSVPRWLEES